MLNTITQKIIDKNIEKKPGNHKGIVLQSVSAKGVANGFLLDMSVRQQYKNNSNKTLEVLYTFPMAWGATFMGLQATIAGQKWVGTVVEKDQAQAQYEQALDNGDTPIMLEKNADGVYTANLGNIKPAEEVTLQYTYSQVLRYEQGSIRIAMPLVIAPRYGDAKKGGMQAHHDLAHDVLAEYPFTLSLDLMGGLEWAAVESPSHQVQVSKTDFALNVAIERHAFLDRDFVLNLSGLNQQSFYIVTPDPQLGPEGCTVMASFCPPALHTHEVQPVRLKILVDCSGSMAGDSMAAAKKALHHIMSQLSQDDSFSYSKFGNNTVHLFSNLKEASSFYKIAAGVCIKHTEADMGGTDIEDALESIFLINDLDQDADVLLITDGEIWNASSLIEVAKELGHRIFAMGVGSAPADSLLKELAVQTGGACELVAPNEDIEQAIVRMFECLRQPKAVEVKVDWGSGALPEWSLGTENAIFAEHTTHVFAGFKCAPKQPASLSYQLKTAETKINISAASVSYLESSHLPRLAAAQRLKTLPQGDQIALALTYSLVTEYTNCLLVCLREDKDKATEFPELVHVANMQVAGWGGAGTVHDVAFAARRSLKAKKEQPIFDNSINIPSFMRDGLIQLSIPEASSDVDTDVVKESDETPVKTPEVNALTVADMLIYADEVWGQSTYPDGQSLEAQMVIFIERVNTHKLPDNLAKIFILDLMFLTKSEQWAVTMAWLLIKLDSDRVIHTNTVQAIKQLASQLSPQAFAMALDAFESEMPVIEFE